MGQKFCFVIILVPGLIAAVASVGFAQTPLTVSSPDGNVKISFQLKS